MASAKQIIWRIYKSSIRRNNQLKTLFRTSFLHSGIIITCAFLLSDYICDVIISLTLIDMFIFLSS